MLGIIGAMDVEVNALKSKVEDKKTSVFAGIEFVSGKIEGQGVCIAQCSPGKVNAALCTQAMLDNFDIDAVINIGVGCSLAENVVIKNAVVATALCQYDFDTSAIDKVKGLVIDGKVTIDADEALSLSIEKSAKAAGAKVHRGIVATGDTFIASQELKRSIAKDFGAICGEMEGGAIAQVCYINGVPFAVLRTISDGGDESAQIDYPEFKEIAAEKSCEIILNFLKK